MRPMTARDLYLLGRRLAKLAEEAMRGRDAPPVPTGLRLIVMDVSEHPDSSIGEIAARTGLPQSHVSHSVARLRARGALETAGDPRDGRRTLVRMGGRTAARAARLGSVPVDGALGAAAGIIDPRELAGLVATLESLAARLLDAHDEDGARSARPPQADPVSER